MKHSSAGFLLRTRAGILSLVLVMGLIIALMMTSLIILAYYYRSSYQSASLEDRLMNNAQSGISYLLATEALQDSSIVDLYGEGIDSVILEKKPWGVFDIYRATAFHKKKVISNLVLTGHKPDGIGKAALYLADGNRPLHLSGDAVINGDSYLPQAGVKTAQIAGKGFSGGKLIQGNIFESRSSLPSLDQRLVNQCLHLPGQDLPSIYKYTSLSSLPDSLSHSFTQPALLYRSDRDMAITQKLSGNIILVCHGTATFTSECQVDNILVFATKIVITENFTGRLQCFANQSIEVEENCRLLYPSVLSVLATREKSLIHVGINSQVEGTILSSGRNGSRERMISLDSTSKFYGHLYTDGLLQHSGKIFGHVTCRKFTLVTPSAVYEDHLHNAEINVEKLPTAYLGAALWWQSKNKGIIKWLK